MVSNVQVDIDIDIDNTPL